ncbi:hypothetical protein [Pseudomonas monteilii]|uniref:hypothetical protein n=1 Tax=Pseudomonas monteilii TaxID=76759 RepID=UPI0015FC3D77|nr:hypothetical protein [Pseudomonas monteilii]
MLSNVNDATKTYATTFFTQIQRAQSITRNGYTVPPARVLAPTLADLNGLGFLPPRSVSPVIYNGQSVSFRVQLTVDTSSGCTVPTCNLPFQVTTTVPLLNPSNNTVDIRRATIAATTASPGNAGVSMPVSFGGNPNIFVSANGTQTGTNPGGVAGLVSVSNGYDSSGFFEFDRRDGSLPRTGDINMQDTAGVKHNINNAGTVNSDASVTGTLRVTGLAVEGQACQQIGLIAANLAGKLLGCNGTIWGKATDMPNSHRYVFTESSEWVVPSGVKSAMVTMAGGGGSGVGWRFASQYQTGHSGGFVFSAPINLVEGEKLNIIVGRGGRGAGPVSSDGTNWYPPSDDDGLAGYPGETTKIVSPSSGTILECGGGSGAAYVGYQSLNEGMIIPGPQRGAYVFSPPYAGSLPSRPALNQYSIFNGPGACGPNDYGRGNVGSSHWSTGPTERFNSGSYPGALTPFGYGSGGFVESSGCYTAGGVLASCVWTRAGRDGVVMIDVLY